MRKYIMIIALLAAGLTVYAQKAVTVKGSTTVLPFAQKAAEAYMNNNPGKAVSISGGGSGVGIAALVDGTTEVAMSSRIIKDSERAALEGNITIYNIAQDAVAMIVNVSNPVENLTQEQVKGIYSGTIKNWKELGGGDVKIHLVNRESSSGTFEAFKTFTLLSKLKGSAQASNQAVVTAVAQAKGGIGYVGLGYIDQKGIKALTLDGVKPSVITVLGRKYPYSRYLYMATRANARAQVVDFINFVRGNAGQKIAESVDLVPQYQTPVSEPPQDKVLAGK
ncbi:MAG: phosphate ABC transporter substrate-binding protein [Elusimicrobiota bacterium]|nr:phosphate ABC transporter substrate-binding protein [Elusimicrobiota bacterium]